MPLIQHLLHQQGKQITFTPDAVDFLHRYRWPGNIRELQAVIYRLIVLVDIDRVSKEILLQVSQISPDDDNEGSHLPATGVTSDETDLLKKQEKRLITHIIEKTDGDRTKASVMLGISPTTLWRKLKQHNISG